MESMASRMSFATAIASAWLSVRISPKTRPALMFAYGSEPRANRNRLHSTLRCPWPVKLYTPPSQLSKPNSA